MALLPSFQTDFRPLSLLQTAWSQILNPLLKNPHNQSIFIKDIQLSVGANSVNHLLGKKLTGWSIIRKRSAASIYDNQDNNITPELTLLLVSDADVTVDLEVF